MDYSPRINHFGLFSQDKKNMDYSPRFMDYSPRIDKLWIFLLGKNVDSSPRINYGFFS